MIWRISILMAVVDLAATASLWYYLADVGISGPFLYALSAAWIFSSARWRYCWSTSPLKSTAVPFPACAGAAPSTKRQPRESPLSNVAQ